MAKRRSAITIFLYLLIILTLVLAAGFNIYLYLSPFSNSILTIELSPADEVIVSNDKTNEALFIISPYNVIYKEEDFETVLLMPTEALITAKEYKSLFSYTNTPYKIMQGASNPFTNIRMDTQYGDRSNKLLVTQSIILRGTVKNEKGILYSGIYVVDFKKLSIEGSDDNTISLRFGEEQCSYQIKVKGGKFSYVDEQWNLLIFEIEDDSIEYEIKYECNYSE